MCFVTNLGYTNLGLCDNRKCCIMIMRLITMIIMIVPYMHEIHQNTTENLLIVNFFTHSVNYQLSASICYRQFS